MVQLGPYPVALLQSRVCGSCYFCRLYSCVPPSYVTVHRIEGENCLLHLLNVTAFYAYVVFSIDFEDKCSGTLSCSVFPSN